jgi:hypothetical protein
MLAALSPFHHLEKYGEIAHDDTIGLFKVLEGVESQNKLPENDSCSL